MNVLRWCAFVHLFDTPFQNSPYGHGYECKQAYPIFQSNSLIDFCTTKQQIKRRKDFV